MRLLVVHAWLTGNLGDVLQTSVLLRALRGLEPAALDLSGCPAVPSERCRPLLDLADRVMSEDPFPRPRSFLGRRAGLALWEVRWRRERGRLFREYDAVLSAPGPFLSSADRRVHSTLLDVQVARALGVPFVLSSHSIGPLGRPQLRRLAAAGLIVAREPATHEYLSREGIVSRLAADYAFLYPRPASGLERGYRQRFGGDYRAAFLRSDNLDFSALRLQDGALHYGADVLAGPGSRLVLATSDPHRDEGPLGSLAVRLGVPFAACETPDELFGVIGGASEIVSDRYHPCVCAAALGKRPAIIRNREAHKMGGLERLLEGRGLEEIRNLAASGLEEVLGFLRAARGRSTAPVPRPDRAR